MSYVLFVNRLTEAEKAAASIEIGGLEAILMAANVLGLHHPSGDLSAVLTTLITRLGTYSPATERLASDYRSVFQRLGMLGDGQ